MDKDQGRKEGRDRKKKGKSVRKKAAKREEAAKAASPNSPPSPSGSASLFPSGLPDASRISGDVMRRTAKRRGGRGEEALTVTKLLLMTTLCFPTLDCCGRYGRVATSLGRFGLRSGRLRRSAGRQVCQVEQFCDFAWVLFTYLS